MTARPITRRRALTVLATGAGMALIPGRASAEAPRLFEWRGTALGGPARIALYHVERSAARAAIAACVAEIERLENEFSLYRAGSALSRLNREGVLDAPSQDMRRLLSESLRFAELSDGTFDISIQPLWRLYAEHFAARTNDVSAPSPEAVAAALTRVNYRRIAVSPGRIALGSGMALTLNGIAQGYITDRVADLLRARGWRHVLIDLGELRALEGRADGRPWLIDVADGGGRTGQGPRIPLADRAVATSCGAGSPFEPTARHHHLLDPRRGASANRYRCVTVAAPRATTADALSTALYLTPPHGVERLLRRAGPAEAWLIDNMGQVARRSG
jgi:thiamine biosynthesis lipoprotein